MYGVVCAEQSLPCQIRASNVFSNRKRGTLAAERLPITHPNSNRISSVSPPQRGIGRNSRGRSTARMSSSATGAYAYRLSPLAQRFSSDSRGAANSMFGAPSQIVV